MPKFRKKPVVIEATQWFVNGDHPEDDCKPLRDANGAPFTSEGKVVRYYRHPGVSDMKVCDHCAHVMFNHGWIDTLEGGHIVCPGDWIITGVKGERYPCKPDIFAATYESVHETDRCLKCGKNWYIDFDGIRTHSCSAPAYRQSTSNTTEAAPKIKPS